MERNCPLHFYVSELRDAQHAKGFCCSILGLQKTHKAVGLNYGLSIATTTNVTYVAKTSTMRRTIPFPKLYQTMSASLLWALYQHTEDHKVVFCRRTNEVKIPPRLLRMHSPSNVRCKRFCCLCEHQSSHAGRRTQVKVPCQAEACGKDRHPALFSGRG
jgi:hypothetical protein